MAGANIKEFADSNFESDVLKSKEPVLVDFWATWCAPCRAIAPHVEALAEAYAGKVKVGKLDIDSSPQTPGRYGVRGIPTLILFKDGKPVDQVVGAVPKAKLEEMLRKHTS
ncbi:MAG: thioredoxin [Myxococcota bacterium]